MTVKKVWREFTKNLAACIGVEDRMRYVRGVRDALDVAERIASVDTSNPATDRQRKTGHHAGELRLVGVTRRPWEREPHVLRAGSADGDGELSGWCQNTQVRR